MTEQLFYIWGGKAYRVFDTPPYEHGVINIGCIECNSAYWFIWDEVNPNPFQSHKYQCQSCAPGCYFLWKEGMENNAGYKAKGVVFSLTKNQYMPTISTGLYGFIPFTDFPGLPPAAEKEKKRWVWINGDWLVDPNLNEEHFNKFPRRYCHSAQKPTHNPLEHGGKSDSDQRSPARDRPSQAVEQAESSGCESRPPLPKGIVTPMHLKGCPQQLWEPGKWCSCDTAWHVKNDAHEFIIVDHIIEIIYPLDKSTTIHITKDCFTEPFIPSWDGDYD